MTDIFTQFIKDQPSGSIDPRAWEEIQPKKNNSKKPTLTEIRDSMGWPTVDITKNELFILDDVVKNIPIRTYRKKDLQNQTLPLLFFIHGGGFFGGSIHNVEQICRTFADKANIQVVSIGYRLAPESPFPAALLDSYNVVEYYATHAEKEKVDRNQFIISGDSAGGNLSITVSLLDHYYLQSNYITDIISYYPVLDLDAKSEKDYYDKKYFQVNEPDQAQLIHQYIQNFGAGNPNVGDLYAKTINPNNPLVNPLLASDDILKSLPPIALIVGEFDPLRVQNDLFVQRLQEINHNYDYTIYNGMVHAFIDKIGDYPQAEEAIIEGLTFRGFKLT